MSQGWNILAELGAIIGLFAFIGYWLDKEFKTTPVLFAVLMLVGYGLGIYHVILYTRRRAEAEEKSKSGR